MGYSNYIFDLYGTLVDIHTNEGKRYLWEKMAVYMRFQGADYTAAGLKASYQSQIDGQRQEKKNRMSKLLEKDIPAWEIEVSLEDVIRDLYRMRGVTALAQQVRDWALMFRAISMEHLSLYEGADGLLKRLRDEGKKIFLLTNAQRVFTEPELMTLGILDCFDAIYYSSDVGFVKPSGYFYQKLLTEQKLDRKATVMVGNDDIADAWGAHDNGFDSIYIYTKQSPRRTRPLPANCSVIEKIAEADNEVRTCQGEADSES